MEHAIGIDLGGSSVKSVAVTPAGHCLVRQQTAFPPDTPLAWATSIRELLEHIQQTMQSQALALGLSAPGLASADGHAIVNMPGRLQGLENLDWTTFLRFSKPVPVLNDAHAALLGESWLGAARGFDNVILLTLGTGVGGAAMVDGRLLRGHLGRAGHLGHICLNPDGPPDICRTPGSLELAIGNCTIRERTQGRFETTHDLVKACVAGDPQATEIWLKSVRALACAIASFINLFDPDAVIIGGGIAQSGPALFDPLGRFLDEVEWRPAGHTVKVLPASLGEYAGAFGSAHHALRGLSPSATDFCPSS